MEKFIKSLGSLGFILTPIISVVSCSQGVAEPKIKIYFNTYKNQDRNLMLINNQVIELTQVIKDNQSIEDLVKSLNQQVTAFDHEGNYLSPEWAFDKKSDFEEGKAYYLNIYVKDAAGNEATASFKVNIVKAATYFHFTDDVPVTWGEASEKNEVYPKQIDFNKAIIFLPVDSVIDNLKTQLESHIELYKGDNTPETSEEKGKVTSKWGKKDEDPDLTKAGEHELIFTYKPEGGKEITFTYRVVIQAKDDKGDDEGDDEGDEGAE